MEWNYYKKIDWALQILKRYLFVYSFLTVVESRKISDQVTEEVKEKGLEFHESNSRDRNTVDNCLDLLHQSEQ